MIPIINWSAILELSRQELPPSAQKRLIHLTDIKHAEKEAKEKAKEQKIQAETDPAVCCPVQIEPA